MTISFNSAYKTVLGVAWLFKQDYDGCKMPEEKARALKIVGCGSKSVESLYARRKN